MNLIIAIIGAPGVGKTFLAQKLAEQQNAIPILEKEKEIPSIIIQNLKNNSNPVQTILWFRNKCIKDLQQALQLKQQGKHVIMDTCLVSNELHITTMTSGANQKILLEQAERDRQLLPHPDIIILLDASAETIRKFTLQRARDFDTNEQFLKRNLSIQKAHLQYYEKNKEKIIYINRDNLDFNNRADLLKIVNKINNFK